MSDRSAAIGAFLASAGWGGAAIAPLAGDASFRHYHRLRDNGARAVLMDAPPEREDVRPFVRIARHLGGLGFSAPAILAADEAQGLLLLEDFGDDTFSRLLRQQDAEDELYALAVDVLIRLHTLDPAAAIPQALPAYDERRLLDEALLLPDWYLPAACGRATDEAVRQSYIACWQRALAPVLAEPHTLVLRDFHVDNLMRLAGRNGLAACGLLDFQDAVAGPAAYDLMSLLEDARRDIAPVLKARMLARYHAGVAAAATNTFATTFATLAAQRHAKVIGIFTRLWRRDGKPVYLAHIPRVWRLLEAALNHPALAELNGWFSRHVPPEVRQLPE
ncbi:MAG: phosphotransferase [Defluviicoccus sp.]|nr:phosphotransferase [Defluviicoccus sp.]MDG4592799.1 phosphotransferase [Defluviicoccus sp.]